jgi:hypothetical protein
LFLLAYLAVVFGCSANLPPAVEKQDDGPAMSPELKAFLAAEDLDDVGDAHDKIKALTPDDKEAIRFVLKQWENAQAVSNLLIHPDLIPEDIRLTSLFRGLAGPRVAYYGLAAIVGFGQIGAEALSAEERKQVAAAFLEVIRKTNDARATRASVSIGTFIDENGIPQVVSLLEHRNDTVRTNLRAWLFKVFKDRDVEAFTAAVGKSGLAAAAQERLIAQFREWQAKPTDMVTLFPYIPNLGEFQPSTERGVVPQER